MIENSYFDKGYAAYHDFIDIEENPYDIDDDNFRLWEAGWLRAKSDSDFADIEEETHPSGVA